MNSDGWLVSTNSASGCAHYWNKKKAKVAYSLCGREEKIKDLQAKKKYASKCQRCMKASKGDIKTDKRNVIKGNGRQIEMDNFPISMEELEKAFEAALPYMKGEVSESQTSIDEDEMQELYENFETTWLLDSIDRIDQVSAYFSDREGFGPPQIRQDMFELHTLAMEAVNYGNPSRIRELFDIAGDLDDRIYSMMESLSFIRDILTRLMSLYPKSLDSGSDV